MSEIEIVRPVGSGLLAPHSPDPQEVDETILEVTSLGESVFEDLQSTGDIEWNDSDLTRFSENECNDPLEVDGWNVNSSNRTYPVEKSSVPFYGPTVAERIYREGESSGSGIAMNRSTPGEPTVLHMGVLLNISENFVNDASNLTKIFYAFSAGDPKVILTVHDGQDFTLKWLLRHSPGNTSYQSPNLVPNADGRVTPGVWEKVELRITSASSPEMGESADGRIEVWLNDLKTHDRGDLDTHFIGEDMHWTSHQWNTIRGGDGPDNPHDMYWWAGALLQSGGS